MRWSRAYKAKGGKEEEKGERGEGGRDKGGIRVKGKGGG